MVAYSTDDDAVKNYRYFYGTQDRPQMWGRSAQDDLFHDPQKPKISISRTPMLAADMDDYSSEEVGEYFRRFYEYGVLPTVGPTESGHWVLQLESDGAGTFFLRIRGETLVDVLQQGDMAVGGWHAQLRIHDSVTKTESVSQDEDILQRFREMQRIMDEQDVPANARCIYMLPETYRELCTALGVGCEKYPSEGGKKFYRGERIVVKSNLPLTGPAGLPFHLKPSAEHGP